jgi:two-component system response regulator (stage 0 sporulation protein F)
MVENNKKEKTRRYKTVKKGILVCDDEKPIRLSLSEMLFNYCEIVEASNGRTAVNVVESESLDLIIIDIKMPHMHGIEAIGKIRQRNQEIPIIVCTAYRKMKDDFTIKNSDVAAFIIKPIDIKALKMKVFELIGA